MRNFFSGTAARVLELGLGLERVVELGLLEKYEVLPPQSPHQAI